MKKTDLHILMLEDEPFDVELNKAQLLFLEEYNCVVKVVGDKDSYLQELDNKPPDIILSDYNLPQYTGLDALNDLKSRNLLIPFIFVTGTMSEETAVGTIKSGAWDYVVKDRLFRLPLAMRAVLQLKEEKLIAAKAEEKNKLLLTAIEQTSSQIIVCNIKGQIEYVNKKFTEISGITSEEALRRDIMTIFPDEDFLNIDPDIVNNLMKGKVFRTETKRQNKDSTMFWELTSITPIKNNQGEVTNFVALKEDISQLKKMELDLIEARDKAQLSDKLKDAFLQNLSHEIRTPLNAIVGFANILHSDSDITLEKIKEYTSIIRDSSNQLLSIVTDILTMASIQTGQETITFKPLNINKLVDNLYEIFLPSANEKKINLTLSYNKTDNPLFILTDEPKLTQILTNLLNNALKFTKKGSVELKYIINGDSIEFSVADTGIGISKESQDLIFERFRQANEKTHIDYGGTGLGLSISKSFAQMMDGKLEVKSELGRGSVFTLSLPLSIISDKVLHKPVKQTALTRDNYIILVAEDEINNYMLLKAYLNLPNITIIYADNGLEAIKICEENPLINMVLMDIKMPVMDGIVAMKKIREFRNKLPIIAQTAYGLENEKQQLLKLGFDDYLSKPIKKEDLFRTIEKHITE
ncbi:MAG TPA: response regulator [Bacteroidales bacterium]|mgnify:CR=1 FL=1|nr:response regulator [Bacteroidales bacterium]HPT21471.1 response regulator [Bacteroidales bacterium]